MTSLDLERSNSWP